MLAAIPYLLDKHDEDSVPLAFEYGCHLTFIGDWITKWEAVK